MAHNAPGKHYRRGMTLAELFDRFPSDVAAEEWFIAQRWPDGARCPHCGCDRVQDGANHPSQRFRCRSCGKRFSARTDTVMANSNIGYRNWTVAVYAVLTNLKGVSSMKLHRDLGITQSSAWFLLHRIREAWSNGTREPFEGPVEADEMYVGGKAKNMSTARHRNAITGRGGVDKVPVAGVKDRATNKVAARPVADTSAASLVPFVASHAQPGAEVFTDEHRSYKPLASLGYCHAAVAHSARQWTDGTASTNGIESLWSMFRRGYAGTYHHMSRAHVGRYVNEFTGRHNIRPLDTEAQMGSVAVGMVTKRLRYDDLVAT